MRSTDIFNYIPLTKSGDFFKNKNILLADSRCEDITDFGCGNISKKRLQLRLTPYYTDAYAFVYDNRSENILRLEINMFEISSKQTPILDNKGIPHKLETKAKNKYILNSEIIPGRIYKESSGVEYLYLGKLLLHVNYTQYDEFEPNNSTPDCCHFYIRMNKDILNIASHVSSMNELYRMLGLHYNKDINTDWIKKCSRRENPRKFVSMSSILVHNPAITYDTFIINCKDKRWKCQYTLDMVKS